MRNALTVLLAVIIIAVVTFDCVDRAKSWTATIGAVVVDLDYTAAHSSITFLPDTQGNLIPYPEHVPEEFKVVYSAGGRSFRDRVDGATWHSLSVGQEVPLRVRYGGVSNRAIDWGIAP